MDDKTLTTSAPELDPAQAALGPSRASSLLTWPWVPIIVLSVIIVATVFAPWLTAHHPTEASLTHRLTPPRWAEGGDPAFLLGTDALGRDILTRIFYGGRISLMVAVSVLSVAGIVGLSLGVLAGYLGGLTSTVVMRLVDSLLALPLLLIAIVFAMSFGASIRTVIISLSLILWARFARIMRGEVLQLLNREFVLQAIVSGASRLRIMLVHIVPNILNTFVVLLTLNMAWVILVEAALSFLGAGVPPPSPSWGRMVADGREHMTSAWWVVFFPGLALGLLVLSVNLLGDWLRDRLDPRLRQL